MSLPEDKPPFMGDSPASHIWFSVRLTPVLDVLVGAAQTTMALPSHMGVSIKEQPGSFFPFEISYSY